MGQTIVITRMKVQSGKGDDFMQMVKPFLSESRKEAGCALYDIYRNVVESGYFIFHEIWNDQAAIDAHMQTAHFGTFMGGAAPILEKIDPAVEIPFEVTIAQMFDPNNPPSGDVITVASRMKAKPDSIDTMITDSKKMIIEPSNGEEGCVRYDLFQNIEEKSLALLFEKWKGFSAIQSHMGTAHFAKFMETAPSFLIPPQDGMEGLFEVMVCIPYGA